MSETIIAYNTEDGVSIIIPTGEIPIEDVIAKDIPANTPYVIINELPTDRIFRECWVISGNNVIEDFELSRAKAHALRRAARDAEFMQWDRLATVPSQREYAESQRVIIRDRYVVMQNDIDGCQSVSELKSAISTII